MNQPVNIGGLLSRILTGALSGQNVAEAAQSELTREVEQICINGFNQKIRDNALPIGLGLFAAVGVIGFIGFRIGKAAQST
jgi:hypothetical protein